MAKKPKIVQIVLNQTSIFGLGDDGKLYRFDLTSKLWVSMED